MTTTYLHPTQQLRVKQVTYTHQYLKELNLATEEAVRCHDKYFASLEKVMSCLLNNSDVLEDVRQTIGPEGAAMAPTGVPTSQLVSAYTNWKASPELDALRGELEALRVLSTEGRHTAKTTKTLAQSLERCATQCAYVNSPAFQSKLAHRTGRAQEKLIHEAREANAKMVQQDTAVYQAMRSTSLWWSAKLAGRTSEMYGALSRLGARTAAVFPPMMYTTTTTTAPAQIVPLGREVSNAAAEAPATMYTTRDSYPMAAATHGSSMPTNGASYTSGVPMEFYEQESTKSAA